MKIQCSCGTKHEFDITPEMSDRPVRFICPSCGCDASEFVDQLVRRQLGQAERPDGPPVDVPLTSSTGQTAVPAQSAEPAPTAPAGIPCLKHPGHWATEHCRVCSKPICSKCMELFGYACSPLCKAKAEAHGISLPVYAHQKSLAEARQWKRIGRVAAVVGVLSVTALGIWFWYAWFGSEPKPIFSVRFPEPAYSGQSIICGQGKDQVVFLHGTTLARHDIKTKKAIWSIDLLDRKAVDAAVQRQQKLNQEIVDRANAQGVEELPKFASGEKLSHQLERDFAASLNLQVRGTNIWITAPGRLAKYDWNTGKALQETVIGASYGGVLFRGDEVVLVDETGAQPAVTRVDLLTGNSRVEALPMPKGAERMQATNSQPMPLPRSGAVAGSGLPGKIGGKASGAAMDPGKVAEQYQALPTPNRLALPAMLANTLTQERTLAALNDNPQVRPEAGSAQSQASLSIIAEPNGFVEMGVRMIEPRFTSRSAMKPDAGKSALSGNVTAGNSTEISSELLNELQRSKGGDIVTEDESRYEVTLNRPGAPAWSGEVVGPPRLFPLSTVTVLAANKSVVVLDKENRKLWQSSLAYNVRPGPEALDQEMASQGLGPCVEHKNSLYVIDEAVLTAFDLATGNARWRLPSVGISGIFFDDRGTIYVNATTDSPDSIKYSKQIDLNRKVKSVVLKVDSRDGKVLWSADSGGIVSYVSGKFIYAVDSYMPEEEDEDDPYHPETGLERPASLQIWRLNPKNGHIMWEHVQHRAPLNMAFDQNTIRLVFKKEVQVLRFVSW